MHTLRAITPCSAAFALATALLVACSSAPADGTPADEAIDEPELRAMTASEIVGTIAFGETKDVDYTEAPVYRALRVDAVTGDVLDAWARSETLDAKLWILDSRSRTLTSNDNASAGTRDAHTTFTVKTSGIYYLAFRDTNREDGRFRVSLAARPSPDAGPARPDAGPASDAGDAGTPPLPASLYGFTAGAKVAQKGAGTIGQNMGPSYQCHRKTTPPIPCGGWVSVTTSAGKTQVALGVMGHSSFYTYVSGVNGADQAYPFPPSLANTHFWAQSAVVELDAAGHGHLDRQTADAQGFVQSTTRFDVSAVDGAITVSYAGSLHPGGCNSYDETCTFRAVTP